MIQRKCKSNNRCRNREVHLYTVKTVVEEVENPELEITLKDANKINKKLTVGDEAYI